MKRLLILALLVGATAFSSVHAQEKAQTTPEPKQVEIRPGVSVTDNVPGAFIADWVVTSDKGNFATGPLYFQADPDTGFVRMTPCDDVMVKCEDVTIRAEGISQGETVALVGQ